MNILKKTLLILIIGIFMSLNMVKAQGQSLQNETFKVYASCGMCKEKIEAALTKKDGIKKRNWDQKTKMLTVSYDPAKTNMEKIQKSITALGYDTDQYKADDDVYNKLPKCCKYDRPLKQ